MLRTLFTNLQKWCFIAGTPVMTMAGPLPIEQIDPGMMVWSAPECGTGQACYRPVLETYRNRAKEVWHVSYDHDADRFTPEETLGASAEHPVWVEETASFLPVSDLRPGMTLRMASGYEGTVGGIRSETSRSPAGTPVFNFAVAEHHTYHAGKGGVWVHNVCPEGLERLKSKYLELLDSGTKTKDEAVKELHDWMRMDKTEGGFTEEDFQQTAEYLFSKAIDSEADDLLRSNPASYYSYTLLKKRIFDAGLSGVAEGLEAHHLLEKRFAGLVGVVENDIISVAVSPLWHRGVRGKYTRIIEEGANIDKLIEHELRALGVTDFGNSTVAQVWQAHKRVYEGLGKDDWAKAIHKMYFEPRNIQY